MAGDEPVVHSASLPMPWLGLAGCLTFVILMLAVWAGIGFAIFSLVS
jgi:hypothetical protein